MPTLRSSNKPPTTKSLTTKPPKMTTKSTPYQLIYWPGIPGRGEHIRLLLEEASAPYTDTAHQPDGMRTVATVILNPSNVGDASNPPPFAPPVLVHGDLTIYQTPNILFYLGKRHGLMGAKGDENAEYKINALVLTALDGLSDEAHDTHHPVAPNSYYEEQKEEAKRKADDYRTARLPKFLGYFERVLSGEASKGGEYLYGGQLTVADLVLWQCLDGVKHAFPKCMGRLEKGGRFGKVFALYERVKGLERIKAYLASERRQEYSDGVWRHYPELDE
jgi:glutathione S-transferase